MEFNYVPIYPRQCVHLRKTAVAIETSCVCSVVYVFAMTMGNVLLLTGDEFQMVHIVTSVF
jgi:hypothetical protein